MHTPQLVFLSFVLYTTATVALSGASVLTSACCFVFSEEGIQGQYLWVLAGNTLVTLTSSFS